MPVEPRGGVFRHWCPGDPFRALAAVTFLQTADAIYRHTVDRGWLTEQVPCLQRTVQWLESLTDDRGRVGGAGFYLERPARIEYDGVTQCAVAHALGLATDLFNRAGADASAACSGSLRERITRCFRKQFWAGDQCVEYIHPERGPITSHGMTDVDWAGLATGIVDPGQEAGLWARLRQEPAFHYNGVPTGIASRPEAYERWEAEDLGIDRHDLAAMGRVWWWEAWARTRMGDGAGLVDTLRKVATAGRDNDWYWLERYYSERTGDLAPSPTSTYCEYPANLIRIVQRFLLGVTYELDGSVSLAPTVPDEYWDRGFGQTLAWGGGTLSYRMSRGLFRARCTGPARRLRVRLGAAGGGGTPRATVNGQPSAVQRDGEQIILDLPANPEGCAFEVSG